MTLNPSPRRPADDDAMDALLRQADPLSTGAAPSARSMRTADFARLAALTRAAAPAGVARADTPSAPRGGRRVRSGRRVAVSGGVVLLAFAGASVAAATPSAPEWLGWLDWRPDAVNASPAGSCSTVAMRVSGTLNDPAVEEARTYLRQLDITTVDHTTRLAILESQTVTDENGDVVGRGRDVYSPQQLVDQAYSSAVSQAVFQHLEETGLPSGSVRVEGRMRGCGPTPSG